ncbi:MAG: T9SS C-terminal target domain-containing protein [Stygiobacter sp.]|nr:MAG: T9SS C-terminal target domain-containing protein [Stygiobacter sp.]
MKKIILMIFCVVSSHTFAQLIKVSKDSMQFFSSSYDNRHRIKDSLLVINDGDVSLRINYIESSERLLLFQISLKHNDDSIRTGFTLRLSPIFPITVSAKDTVKIVFIQTQATTKISNTLKDWKDSLTISNNSLNKPFLKIGIWGNTILDVQNEESIPKQFALSQNYPNPFNPETTINFTIPNVETTRRVVFTTLKVYDVLGREVATLVDEYKQPGNYNVSFNVETCRGKSLPSGIYFYRLQSGSYSETKKLILLR